MGRHSKIKSTVIKEKIVQGAEAGKNQGVIASELAVSRKHVNRTLAELRDKFKDRAPEAFAAYVHQQIELLTQAIEEVWEGTLPPDAANSIRGLMDSIARLTGSNAPEKRITEHREQSVEPNLYKWIHALHNLVAQELLPAWKADVETATKKYAQPYEPHPIVVPAHILQENNHDPK